MRSEPTYLHLHLDIIYSLSMNFRVLVSSRKYMFRLRPPSARNRLIQMAHLSTAGTSLAELPKSNVFTSKLPPDPAFDTPESSHKAPRETLGPRMVKGALFTYVRPEQTDEPELLGVSSKAMKDLGLKPGEEQTSRFKALVAGNEIWWNEEQGGVYPWAQCYGGQCPRLHEQPQRD
jgi:hypothetical protein